MFIRTDEIVADAVREFWKKEGPQEVVAFFWQKYAWENDEKWEWCEELIECHSDTDYDTVYFLNDFNEGQTDIKGLTIVTLREITETFTELKGLNEKGEVIDSDLEDWDRTDSRFTSAEEQREILRMAGEAFASGLQKALNEKGGR